MYYYCNTYIYIYIYIYVYIVIDLCVYKYIYIYIYVFEVQGGAAQAPPGGRDPAGLIYIYI